MKVLLSWVRDFIDVTATADAIGQRMSMRGLALEGIEPIEPGAQPPWSRHTGPDAVLDFEVTSNRPDCLSIVGIAREIATAFDLAPPSPLGDLRPRQAGTEVPSAGTEVPVTIEDPDLCARYAAAVASVSIGPSPDWMQARLAACGVRPISNVVDITNYVLLELGHPMHAFDLARLRGGAIVVRRARPNESIRTLDGKMRSLAPDMLVIADAERASAIGGVMGGADSEVSSATREIVFESAWFKPQSVRSTSKRLGLKTEASYRFERGADLTAPVAAMERALALLEMTGAGRAAGPIVDAYPVPYAARTLSLEARSIPALLGMDVPADDVERILHSLGFETQALGGWQVNAPDAALAMGAPGASWRVTTPPWRVDIHRTVDLIEEVGRHHGFEHLPTTFPPVEQAPPPSDPRIARDERIRKLLLAMGFSEAITFAFIESAAAAPFLGDNAPVLLANPLSETFTTLRPSLLPGLIDAVSRNRRHGRRDVRLFEIGTCFSPQGESRGAAVVWTGLATPDHWSGGQREVDFFDVKGVAERIAESLRLVPGYAAIAPAYLIEGRAAALTIAGNQVGVMGQLAPAIAEQRDLPAADAIYVAEFDLDRLSALAADVALIVKPLPRHPFVVRDVAILVDDTLSAETVRGTIRAAHRDAQAGPSATAGASPVLLVDVREFDRYQGKGIPDGKVSLALRLTFQAADRTLTDAEVQSAMQAIVGALKQQLAAIQR